MSESEFIEVANFALETEARQMQSLLESNGVPAFIDGATANTMMSYVGTALGGVRLLVKKSDVAAAAEILQSINHQDATDGGPWHCGECGEDVDAGFDLCWACGKPRSEVAMRQLTPTSQPPDTSDDDTGELAEVETNPADEATLRRAWRTSIIGLCLFPVVTHLYSMYLLIRVSANGRELAPPAQNLFYLTMAINVVGGCVWSVILKRAFVY